MWVRSKSVVWCEGKIIREIMIIKIKSWKSAHDSIISQKVKTVIEAYLDKRYKTSSQKVVIKYHWLLNWYCMKMKWVQYGAFYCYRLPINNVSQFDWQQTVQLPEGNDVLLTVCFQPLAILFLLHFPDSPFCFIFPAVNAVSVAFWCCGYEKQGRPASPAICCKKVTLSRIGHNYRRYRFKWGWKPCFTCVTTTAGSYQ